MSNQKQISEYRFLIDRNKKNQIASHKREKMYKEMGSETWQDKFKRGLQKKKIAYLLPKVPKNAELCPICTGSGTYGVAWGRIGAVGRRLCSVCEGEGLIWKDENTIENKKPFQNNNETFGT